MSSVCLVRPGVYHKIRLSVAENGVLAFYFDGVQVIGEKEMPSFSGVKVLPPKWWPILFFGVDSNDPEHLRGRLNGLIDDIALYDRALGAPGTETAETADYSGVAIPKFGLADDAVSDVLVLDENGRAKTGTFRVLDSDAGHGAGAWFKAEEKFVKCAARAAIGVTADTLTVSVDCPVPAGLEIAREKGSVWSGDLVEIFLRPSLSDRSYFHYAVNAAGLTFVRHVMANGSSDPAFTSAFASEVRDRENGFRVTFRIPRGEVFDHVLAAGDVFAANFTRGGKTVGGLSTWAAVGRNFNEPDLFGRVVIGGAKAYFDRLLAEKRAEAGRMFTTPAQVEVAGKALADAERAVSDNAGNLAAFTSLEAYFANLDRMFLQLAMNGRNYMLYRPDDPWGNDIAPWPGFYKDMSESERLAQQFGYKDNPVRVRERLFGEKWELVWRKEVKGVTFVGSQWRTLHPPIERYMREHAKELDPTKPFFYCQHAHPAGTCHGGLGFGDEGEAVRALSAFPNAVAISGHTHCTLADERAVWQGAFTSIGAGCTHSSRTGMRTAQPSGTRPTGRSSWRR